MTAALAKADGAGLYEWVTDPARHAEWSGHWFGPGRPLEPQAQHTAGRQWDYAAGRNLQYLPKQGEGVTFDRLRALADGYDLLRLVIETRKDEMEFCEWKVQTRDGKENRAAKRVAEMLTAPDREHTWHQWQRMLLEELFVTDAPAIYVRKTLGGDPHSLEILDGATIHRLLKAVLRVSGASEDVPLGEEQAPPKDTGGGSTPKSPRPRGGRTATSKKSSRSPKRGK